MWGTEGRAGLVSLPRDLLNEGAEEIAKTSCWTPTEILWFQFWSPTASKVLEQKHPAPTNSGTLKHKRRSEEAAAPSREKQISLLEKPDSMEPWKSSREHGNRTFQTASATLISRLCKKRVGQAHTELHFDSSILPYPTCLPGLHWLLTDVFAFSFPRADLSLLSMSAGLSFQSTVTIANALVKKHELTPHSQFSKFKPLPALESPCDLATVFPNNLFCI